MSCSQERGNRVGRTQRQICILVVTGQGLSSSARWGHMPALPLAGGVTAKCTSVLCSYFTPPPLLSISWSLSFIYFFNEIHFQMLLGNVWMPSTVLGMFEWRIRKWEQGLASVSLDASSMKAREQTARGWDGAKCLAQFREGEFSWEYPTFNQQEFAAVKINGLLWNYK